MSIVKRSRTVTYASVVDQDGNVIGEVMVEGRASAARLANVARRDFGPLVTVRDIGEKVEFYTMSTSRFYQLANKVEGE